MDRCDCDSTNQTGFTVPTDTALPYSPPQPWFHSPAACPDCGRCMVCGRPMLFFANI